MNDKTLGAYKRTTPDPDETTGEAPARLQAEMTRLLDEADAELRGEAEGGVAAALIEKEAEKPTAADFAKAKFARDPGGDATAHRTPMGFWTSRTFHGIDDEAMALGGWSPVRECPAPDDHALSRVARAVAAVTPCSCSAQRARAEKAEKERDEARATKDMHKRRADEERARADQAEKERDHWKREADNANEDLAHLRAAVPRPLTPDAITDGARDRAYRAVAALSVSDWDDMSGVAKGRAMALVEAVITEITRPEPPARPEWINAPAVRAWHKHDGRTEHDGTPGKPRIWSPDYGTTETWSTPSLPNVPWQDLVDVEPLAPEDGAA